LRHAEEESLQDTIDTVPTVIIRHGRSRQDRVNEFAAGPAGIGGHGDVGTQCRQFLIL